jgi:Cu(I)/Ag(I) efflux system periplasmic protein CusF
VHVAFALVYLMQMASYTRVERSPQVNFSPLRRARFVGLLAAGALVGLSVAASAAEGEVRKVDAAQGKITIKHGAIKNLDMPPMTMVYKAKPPSLLKDINEGDRISFEAEKVDGQYVVTSIRKLP